MSVCICTPKQKDSGRYSKRCRAHPGFINYAGKQQGYSKQTNNLNLQMAINALSKKLGHQCLLKSKTEVGSLKYAYVRYGPRSLDDSPVLKYDVLVIWIYAFIRGLEMFAEMRKD